MMPLPTALIAASLSVIIGQSWKVFNQLLRKKALDWRLAFQAGGMPSSHTAAVVSMALVIGLREGFASSVFVMALLLCGVVIHDAIKVRGTLNTIIRILQKSVEQEVLETEEALPVTIGHTVGEVIAGFLLAAAVAASCHWFLP